MAEEKNAVSEVETIPKCEPFKHEGYMYIPGEAVEYWKMRKLLPCWTDRKSLRAIKVPNLYDLVAVTSFLYLERDGNCYIFGPPAEDEVVHRMFPNLIPLFPNTLFIKIAIR